MAKLQTAVNKVKRLEKQTNPVNNMPEGLGAGSINTAMRDNPQQSVNNSSQMPEWIKTNSNYNPYPPSQQPSQADLYAIQEKRRLQALEQQKRNALATLKQEKAQVNPAFHTGLSNIAGQSARQARNLAEYLAQRGQTQSGIAAQGEMQMQSDLLSQQGLLEQQRINALADIARRESEVRGAYDSGALDAAMERQYNTLQGQLAEQERARQEGIATVGQYYDDYAAQLNKIAQMEAMGDFSQSYLKPYLTMARQQKQAEQAQAQAKAEQQKFENWLAVQKLRKTGSGGSGGGGVGGMPVPTFAQALDAWNSGIDTPQIREVLGIGNQIEQMEAMGDYNTVVNNVKRALAGTNAASPSAWNAVVSYLKNAVMNGVITEAQASTILSSIGLE